MSAQAKSHVVARAVGDSVKALHELARDMEAIELDVFGDFIRQLADALHARGKSVACELMRQGAENDR